MTAEPGWYSYRAVPAEAEWDGTAWSGSTRLAAAPELAGPHRPFAFLRQAWVWWMIAGQLLVLPPAVASGVTGGGAWSWLSAPGYIAFMVGTVLVMVRYLPVGKLPGLRTLTGIGVVAGVIGFGIAFGLETLVDHRFGVVTVLWSTGPIEEGAKILIPFALLVFGSARFKDPLVGLYLVLVSGATTGAMEGTEWQARAHHDWYHLQLALVRPSAEVFHVFATGFAAAVIWLAAWRRKSAFTVAGTLAFALVVGIHSLHDGFFTVFGVSPKPDPSAVAHSAGDAVAKGLIGAFFAIGLGIAAFVLGRHGARELSTPDSVAHAVPAWRPQIKTWGAVDPVRAVFPVPDAVPPGPWYPAPAGYGQHPYGAPSYGAPGAPPGWYPYGADASRQAWWDGATWSAPVWWDGWAWRPE